VDSAVKDGDSEVSGLMTKQLAVVEDSLLPLVERASRDLAESKEMHDHIIQLLNLIQRVEAKLRTDYGV